MNKSDLIKKISADLAMTEEVCRKVFDAAVDEVAAQMKAGESVTISGFGCFKAKSRAGKKGLHPKTGDVITIPARTVPTFKASKTFVAELNE